MCLPDLVHSQDEDELLAAGGVSLGDSLRVVSLVRRALKGKHEVVGVDHGDVLVIVERAVVAVREQVHQDQMVPGAGRSSEEEGGTSLIRIVGIHMTVERRHTCAYYNRVLRELYVYCRSLD